MIKSLAKKLIINPLANQINALTTRAYEGATHSKISLGLQALVARTKKHFSHLKLYVQEPEILHVIAYATRAITSIASNTIGTGIVHQFKNFDQNEWNNWAESTDCDADGIHTYNGIQNLVMREIVESGECLIQKIISGYDRKNIPLKLRVIESEYLDMTRNGFYYENNYVSQGIEINALGQRVAYWIYPFHPENDLGWRHTSVRVPASEIIHVFRCDRAGQNRGITWLAPVMMEFRNIDNYQAAELKRREVSACYAAFIKYMDGFTDSVPGLKNKVGKLIEKISPGMIAHLQPGQDVTFSSPQSDASYDPYISSVLRKIAVGMGMTSEILSGNLSKVNFSSGRMGFLEFQRNIDMWRWHMMIPMFNTKVSNWFLETASIAGYNVKKTEVVYTAAHREMIDPPKEIAAMRDAIRSGLKSYQEALRELGYNPLEVIKEISEFNRILDKHGIKLDTDPRNCNQQGQIHNTINKIKVKKVKKMAFQVIQRSMKMPHKSNEIDIENRTVPIIWSTGAPVLRKKKKNNPHEADSFFYEVLDMNKSSVNITDLNSGAPILVDHMPQSVRNTIGVIVENSVDIINGKGVALGRFATDPDSDSIFTKVKDKVITKVSSGYHVLEGFWKRKQENELYDTLYVTKWHPIEVSVVSFPADKGTLIGRNEDLDFEYDLNNIITRGESIMDPEEIAIVNTENPIPPPTKENDAIKERKRIKDIEFAVRAAKLPEEFATRFIDEGTSIHKAREDIFKEMEKISAEKAYFPRITGGNPVESIEKRNNAISEGILHRFDPQSIKLNESSARFRNMSILNIARLTTNSDIYVGTHEIVERALSTSDFPNLMANVLNKKLRREYEVAPRTYEPLVFKTEVVDFKPVTRIQMGDISQLLEKPEHSEYKEGKFGEASETYAIKEYGRAITISRRMLINDDLSAMLRLPSMCGRLAAELESDIAWDCITNSKLLMNDNLPLFDVKHKNISSAGSKITVDSIADGIKAMRSQTGLSDGKDKPSRLNLRPVYLIVSAALESTALQFVHSTSPTKDQDTNPYKSQFKLIVEPRLDDLDPKSWYLAADLGQIDLLEMAYLQGQSGLYMESKVDFNTDGIKLKCRMDVGAKAIDFRGFYKNTGA